MRAESGFVAFYSLMLLALAAGLHRLGRVNTVVWSSRVLAGHRRAAGDSAANDAVTDWPHSEVPRLHTGMALVAAGAATLIAAVQLLLHHRLAEVLVLGAVVLMGLAALLRLARRLR